MTVTSASAAASAPAPPAAASPSSIAQTHHIARTTFGAPIATNLTHFFRFINSHQSFHACSSAKGNFNLALTSLLKIRQRTLEWCGGVGSSSTSQEHALSQAVLHLSGILFMEYGRLLSQRIT
uniref:SFRICE_032406 n=1 Tax=Spodoptera frugiperda TaxID=7108 RepID=A0A2H1WPP2_SPOFR